MDVVTLALAKKYTDEHSGSGMPDPGVDGTALVSIDGEWVSVEGYGYMTIGSDSKTNDFITPSSIGAWVEISDINVPEYSSFIGVSITKGSYTSPEITNVTLNPEGSYYATITDTTLGITVATITFFPGEKIDLWFLSMTMTAMHQNMTLNYSYKELVPIPINEKFIPSTFASKSYVDETIQKAIGDIDTALQALL